ncbi:pilus assembly protein TadG-related protein [Methylocystis sp. JR02]|uniref:TadE/TadG family type IV pilus assembly protein n=1 Tax=Methylocystis sp. JR02 TaxID=3046284 RepID=UPI0032D8C5B1
MGAWKLRLLQLYASTSRRSAFAACQRGTVAILFGLALLPVALLVGGAVDYSAAVTKKSRLQEALDKGVLAAAAKGVADSALLNRYLNANMPVGISAINATLAVSTAANGAVIYASDATFAVQTAFLKIIGMNSINVGAHSEATLPTQIVTATFNAVSAKGAFAKDMFLWTKNASGAVTSKQTVLSYRYGVSGSGTNPPVGAWTVTFSVPKYSTYGVGMVAYQDLSYQGGLINPVEFYSDVNSASFRKTGNCQDSGGAQYNVEDGGDNDYLDFVYTMKCALGVASNSVARLSK